MGVIFTPPPVSLEGLKWLLQIIHAIIAINRTTNDQTSKQESPAVADKHARRESMPKITPIRRAYNVVANNAGLSSFV